MDATRARRTRDRARQKWYARYRQLRFARFLGFAQEVSATTNPTQHRGIHRLAVATL
jgi:hypothetical protein